jgi:para-nitrobenzyl esterase
LWAVLDLRKQDTFVEMQAARLWIFGFTLLFGCGAPAGALIGDGGPSASPDATDASASAQDGSSDIDGSGAPPTPGRVRVTEGLLQGRQVDQAWTFLGVPYAAPPVGDLRWKHPRPPTAWTDVRDATQLSNTCIQITTGGQLIGGAEDCLYLNIWTPSPTSTAALPVLFWIHGGFYLSGSGSDALYDGAYVAQHARAVVVTINYRLGTLGFVDHPLLALETTDGASGNYGHYDQVAALQWVQANIASFGGDPRRVVVYGASAGGGSSCALYASPIARGLFSAAIMESGGACASLRHTARTGADFQAMAQSLGCTGAMDVLACMRSKPAEEIATALPIDYRQAGSPRLQGLVVDGRLFPKPPLSIIAEGGQNPVPFMLGTTADEYSTLLSHYSASALATDADYQAEANRILGPTIAQQALAQYPSTDYGTPKQALIQLMTDYSETCLARAVARRAAAHGLPVYRYLWAHTYESGSVRAKGAGHYMDVPFQFHNLATTSLVSSGFVPSAAELALSDTMIGYWTRLAASGDPNGAGAPDWPLYVAAADNVLTLDDVPSVMTGVRTAHCDFWDQILGL